MKIKGEKVPGDLANILKKRAEDSSEGDFDLKAELKEIVESQIEFYNRYQRAGGNDRFREEFSRMMFEQYLKDNS